MQNELTHQLLVIEPSDVIFEGIYALMHQYAASRDVLRMTDLEALGHLPPEKTPAVILINPSQIIHREKLLTAFRKRYPGVLWMALVYQYFPAELLAAFDAIIDIHAPGEEVIRQLVMDEVAGGEPDGHVEALTEREKDVLLWLVKGMQNKEIADKLNISIHTVISHRKNITQKTGIKSQAGLVIYAISNKLMTLGV